MVLFGAALGAKSQAPFIPKDQLSEPPSAAWPWASNAGQVFDVGGNDRSDVYFHTVGTFPILYAMKQNRVAIVVPKDDLPTHAHDSLKRVDFAFTGPGAKDPIPILWDSTQRIFNFYERFNPEGVTGVPSGRRVIYEEIYDGIDMQLYSNAWGPKMYIIIKPSGDPSDIRITWYGHDSLGIDLQGYLDVWFKHEFIKLTQGMAYQQDGNNIVAVPWTAMYSVSSDSLHTSFSFGSYNPQLPLILMVRPFNPDQLPMADGPQPPEWCTFMAGSQDDEVNDVTHDADGFVYFTGGSKSGADQLPISEGVQEVPGGGTDVIVGRFNEFYEIETQDTWMTYIGGPGDDFGSAVAYDVVNERITVVGAFRSTVADFPNQAYPDNASSYQRYGGALTGFVAFIDAATGQRQYLSRTPGEVINYDNTDVCVDSEGNTFVVGFGSLPDLSVEVLSAPTGSYVQDPFDPESPATIFQYKGYILRLDPTATLTWATPLGGPGDEYVHACAVDPLDRWVYVVGSTEAPNNPAYTGSCTAAAAEFEFPLCPTPQGYFQSEINGFGADPVPVKPDGFIMRFKLPEMTLGYSSYIGGVGDEVLTDIAIGPLGDVYVTGASSTLFYNTNACAWGSSDDGIPACDAGGYFNASPAGRKQFIARFDDDMKMTWSTKIGDNDLTFPNYYTAKLATDESGSVYLHATTAYIGNNYTLPVAPTAGAGYYFNGVHNDQGNSAQRTDAYVVKFNGNTEVELATFFGGIGFDEGRGITATNDRLYVCGRTTSVLNFPTNAPNIPDHAPYLNDVPQAVLNQVADGYLAQLKFDATIGFDEPHVLSNSSTLLVYPNPANETISISLPARWPDATALTVTNALGQVVARTAGSQGRMVELAVGDLAPGLYQLQATKDRERAGAKVVIAR